MTIINSESDNRTANNAVRHQYRVLSDAEKAQMVELKDLGAAFIAKCDEIGSSLEMSLAKSNAKQAVMWAVKHVLLCGQSSTSPPRRPEAGNEEAGNEEAGNEEAGNETASDWRPVVEFVG